jgi:hypothetical protein
VLLVIIIIIINVIVLLLLVLLHWCALGFWALKHHKLYLKRLLLLRYVLG